MSIAVITYEQPHRKTQGLLCRLKALVYFGIALFALPFVARAIENSNHEHPVSSF